MDSDEEREEENPQWKGIPGTMVLINAYNNSKITSIAHVATCRVLKNYLRSSTNHQIGVCIYGVKNPNASKLGQQDVIEIFSLAEPSVDNYKKLENLDFSKYEQANELKLSDALGLCNKMFTYSKKQLMSRTIIILTKLDIPPSKSDQKLSCTRAADLASSNVYIKLINISEENYKVHPFYEDFLIEANNGKDITLPLPVSNLEEIEKLIQQQSHRHLAIGQLTFHIGDGFDISVGVYKLLKQNSYRKTEKLDRDTNAIVVSINKTLKVSTESAPTSSYQMDVDEKETKQNLVPLLKSETIHYQEFGDERIEFTDEEKKYMTNPFGSPMIKLLGFKSTEVMCKEKWFVKPGYFLYPNEDIVEGSTVAFKALHQACIDMSVVALCMLCTRVNSKPYIVALSPCSNPLGLNIEIGFNIIIIPFVENVRNLSVLDDDIDEVIPEHKNAMKNILNSLTFEYKPDMFENPKLQSQYRNIEAIALLQENVEPFVDTTKPTPDRFETVQGDLFEKMFGPFGAIATKRPATKENTGEPKKEKLEDIDEDLLQDRIRNRKVNLYKVDQLRHILKYKNIPNIPALTGFKKNDLVEMVYKHCHS
ncbi:inverted repeat-binding protein [Aphomia sociella]